MSQRNIDDDTQFNCVYDMLIRTQARLKAYEPVIEAAKALHAKMSRGEFASTANEQALVWQAVEALQEVEGG